MTIGIYLFKFPSNLPYIGQSIDIERRFKDHCRHMQQGKHSKKVQAEYDKYKVLPTFEILAECSKEELNDYENECIEIYDSVNNGLNTLEIAEDNPGGYTSGSAHSFRSNTEEQILEVFYYLVNNPELMYREISEKTNVPRYTVSQVSRGISHKWLEQRFPEEYSKMLQINRSDHYSANKHFSTAKARGISYPLIESPSGQVYEVTCVSSFARMHGLNGSNLSVLLNQTIPKGRKNPPSHHKGWRLAPEQGVQHAS